MFPIHRSSILDSILSVLGGSLILLKTFGSEFLAFKKKFKEPSVWLFEFSESQNLWFMFLEVPLHLGF